MLLAPVAEQLSGKRLVIVADGALHYLPFGALADPNHRGGKAGEAGIARLPCTRQEAEQIMALVPAGAGMTALDFEASRATAMSERLGQYRYVHFATHGLADSERPELCTLVFSLFDE